MLALPGAGHSALASSPRTDGAHHHDSTVTRTPAGACSVAWQGIEVIKQFFPSMYMGIIIISNHVLLCSACLHAAVDVVKGRKHPLEVERS